jgi:hypothetical protein
MNAKGETSTVVLIVLALAALGFVKIPALFDRDTARAEDSQQATEQLLDAQKKQGAYVAASVQEIGVANAMAPESPSKAFISREVPSVLSSLPSADPIALIEAERRRMAVMEGRLTEANRLYGEEAVRAEKLASQLAFAQEARRQADQTLLEAAAAKKAKDQQMRIIMLIAGLLAVLWVYSYLTRLGPKSIGMIAADIRSGSHPIAALDSHVPDWLKSSVRKQAKLAQDIQDL